MSRTSETGWHTEHSLADEIILAPDSFLDSALVEVLIDARPPLDPKRVNQLGRMLVGLIPQEGEK